MSFCLGANFANNQNNDLSNIKNKVTDLKNGVYEFVSEDNGVKYEIPVKNGQIHGQLKEYSADNQALLSKVEYVAGVKKGLAISYYSDGKIKTEVNFLNNQQDGITKSYYENGNLRYIMPYRNNIPHGNASMYNEAGVLVRSAVFKHGEVTEDTPFAP